MVSQGNKHWSTVQHCHSFIWNVISVSFVSSHNLLTDTLPWCNAASKPITTHLLVSQTHALPTPDAPRPIIASEIPALPLPSSQRYVHPQHLLKGRFIPTGALPFGSRPKDVEMLQEVSDSESGENEGPTKKAAPTIGDGDIEADVPPHPVSPAAMITTTPIATVRNLRKRKKEPVIGGDGRAPKKRRKDK